MFSYLRRDLGLSESFATERAKTEVQNTISRNFCDECEALGLTFAGRTALDLGSGLGGLAAEMARRGATVVAIEPGTAWRAIAAERLAQSGNGLVVGAVGEALPIASDSIDLIASLQVLEHVQHPEQVIREAFRVLKPGGQFFFSYENYLSFWEPHYRVRWLPLLPKPIGSIYLRHLGRDAKFLEDAVTYTTFPSVRRALFRAGFRCTRIDNFTAALRSPEKTSPKWKALKVIAAVHEGLGLRILTVQDYLARTLKTAVYERIRKPH